MTTLGKDTDDRLSDLEKEVSRCREAEKTCLEQMIEIEVLNKLARDVNTNLSIRHVVQEALPQIKETIAADVAFIFLKQGESLECIGLTPSNSACSSIGAVRHRLGECLCGVAAQGSPVYSTNIHADARCTKEECKNAGIRSFAAFPLQREGTILGILGVASEEERDFSIHSDFLEAITAHLAIGLHNAALHEELELRVVQQENLLRKLEKKEESLRQSENTLESILLAAPIAIGLLKDRIFTWVSTRMSTMTGYAMEELIGKSARILYPSDEEFEWVGKVKYGQLRHADVGELDTVWRKKDGPLFDVHLRSCPLNRDDYSQGFIFTALDITDRKIAEKEKLLLERQLLHAQKLESLGILAGGIAHDFNNILMAILGNAEIALLSISHISPARKNILEIEKAARRAAELCRQMLAYSGKGKFIVEILDMNRIIEEMIDMMTISIPKSTVLKFKPALDIPSIEGDASQISQVVMNLVVNASEAIGKKSGIITITTGAMDCDEEYLTETFQDDNLPPGLYVFLEISDTGCGMDETTRARIFDPFFTTKFTGRGLGMSAVLGIMRGHHGAIKLYSEPNRGTTVKILFPAVTGAALPGKKENEKDSAGKEKLKGTILLVDDDETVRSIGKQLLGLLGLSVITAVDGSQAVAIFKEGSHAIDCVLLDLTMPRMDGRETFSALRRIRSDIPIIMTSGYNEQEVVQQFCGKELTGFIQKPYQLSVLADTLRKVLKDQE